MQQPKYGIIADVHSNLQALEAVLTHLEEREVDEIYCLGDVVGYGGDPGLCIHHVKHRCAGTIRGNHDVAAIQPERRSSFNPHARKAIERQGEMLTEEERTWLASLPETITLPGMTLTHSGFDDPEAFRYVNDPTTAAREFSALRSRVGFLGHTHVPVIFRQLEVAAVEAIPLEASSPRVSLADPDRYIVNPGAVGQPRDRNPRAACGIVDTGSWEFHHIRVDYDIGGAQAAIVREGMPSFEASRLTHGI